MAPACRRLSDWYRQAFILVPMTPGKTSGEGGLMTDMVQREELASFLRSRREATDPVSVGLRPGPRRRTPGLRREEVAQLSGVSVTWYTWLEQGRDISASAQVIDALARVLLRGGAQPRPLRELAAPPPPETSASAGGTMPRLQRLADAQAPSLASIYDEHF